MTAGTATSLGDWATIAVKKHTKRMLRYERRVLADRDPEQLHQMRVSARRLRSALSGFAPAIRVPRQASAPAVGRVARRLGRLRDLDVLLGHLEGYSPHLPEVERDRLQKVLRVLAKERKSARKDVRSALASKSYQRLKKGLQRWLQHPHQTAISSRAITTVLPDLLLPLASRLLLHPGWTIGESAALAREIPTVTEVEALLAADETVLHDLRKEAKRVRYQLELFSDFYGQTYANWVRAIKEIQTILGDLQDSYVEISYIHKVLGKGGCARALPTLWGILQEWRYRRWLQWQALQRFFLNPQQQRQFRACLANPLTLQDTTSTFRRSAQEVLSLCG